MVLPWLLVFKEFYLIFHLLLLSTHMKFLNRIRFFSLIVFYLKHHQSISIFELRKYLNFAMPNSFVNGMNQRIFLKSESYWEFILKFTSKVNSNRSNRNRFLWLSKTKLNHESITLETNFTLQFNFFPLSMIYGIDIF